MKTAFWVYFALWALTVGPLWLLNIRKFRRRRPGEQPKTNWKVISVVVVVTVLLSGLWSSLFLDNRSTRYELASDSIFMAQAAYLRGEKDADALKKATSSYYKDGFDVNGMLAVLDQYKGAKSVRFQFSDRVSATGVKGYENKANGFPQTQKVDDENPIYVICRMEIDGEYAFFCVRFERNDKLQWKLDYMAVANKEQVNSVDLPDIEYGAWHK